MSEVVGALGLLLFLTGIATAVIVGRDDRVREQWRGATAVAVFVMPLFAVVYWWWRMIRSEDPSAPADLAGEQMEMETSGV